MEFARVDVRPIESEISSCEVYVSISYMLISFCFNYLSLRTTDLHHKETSKSINYISTHSNLKEKKPERHNS